MFVIFLIFILINQLKSIGYVAFGTLAATFILNIQSTIFLWTNVLAAILINKLRKPTLSYLFFFVSLILIHKQPAFATKEYLFGDDSHKVLLFDVSTAWLHAKCLSFSIDRIRHPDLSRQSDMLIFAYCFYFPVFFTGPIHHYKDFVQVSQIFEKA